MRTSDGNARGRAAVLVAVLAALVPGMSAAGTGEGAAAQVIVETVGDVSLVTVDASGSRRGAWAGAGTRQAYDAPLGSVVVPRQGGLEVVAMSDPAQRTTVVDGGVGHFELARDERTAAVSSERGVEVVDLDTGSRWVVRERASTAAWAPDERRLAVAREGVVEIVDVLSGEVRELIRADAITVPGWCGERAADALTVEGWSPGGGVVLVVGHDFGCDEYAHSALVGVDAATGAHAPLSADNVSSVEVVDVHPFDDRVAYSATLVESGPPQEVFVSGVRGDARRDLGRGIAPAWSPDGTQLAWWRYGSTALVVSDLAGEPRQLGEPFGFGPLVSAWAPDSSALLVTPYPSSDNAFLVDVATGERRHLFEVGDYASPRWAWLGTEPVAVRSAGDDRIGTAAAVARRWFPAPQRHAVVARADDFADALAAGSVVAVDGGPVLLTASDALAPTTAATLERLDVRAVTIMGGATAVSDRVADDLDARGYEVRRVGGSDRAQTAARAAELLPDADLALLASGDAFPDALALGPLAVAAGAPILLSSRDALPRATADFLAEDRPGRLLVAGGTAAVSDAVVREAEAVCGCVAQRLAGDDRTATAVAVAHELERVLGATAAGAFLAAGDRFPDALAAAAAAGRAGRPLLLTQDRTTLGTATTAYLSERAGSVARVDVVGDATVVAEVAVAAAVASGAS